MIEQHNTIIIIPARLASTRLPGKPLANIHGVPLIVEVWKRAVSANIGHVLVAAAENAIADAVRAAGGDAMVTDARLPSSSDRIAAALALRDSARRFDYVLNLPSSLPTIEALSVQRCLAGLTNDKVDIATLAAPMHSDEDVANPAIVKAIAPLEGEREVAYARDFVRSVDADMAAPFWRHINVFAFRREALEQFASLPVSPREKDRSLEQMRALDGGLKIAVVKVDSVPLSVDTPADLETLRRMLK